LNIHLLHKLVKNSLYLWSFDIYCIFIDYLFNFSRILKFDPFCQIFNTGKILIAASWIIVFANKSIFLIQDSANWINFGSNSRKICLISPIFAQWTFVNLYIFVENCSIWLQIVFLRGEKMVYLFDVEQLYE
jgi:hypothetical protein